ncbi:ATP-dependent RNA helicase dbp6 [Orbilia ellipsospora]|uniref:ATP-dependent RNA helicase n=1 Tax=Orbilia ellipsospora TaxID=2528407 RepID=A0AAV9XE62_9PEZI
MSKKRKRDSNLVPAAEEPASDAKPKKEKSKSRKDRAERHGGTLKDNLEESQPSELNFGSLANAPEADSAAPDTLEGEDVSSSIQGESMEIDNSIQNTKESKKKKTTSNDTPSKGHLSILSKFDKYRADILESTAKSAQTESVPEEPLQGLHPLPQPAQVPTQKVDPNSVLPSYLSRPTTVPTTQRPPFNSFDLPNHILSRLEKLDITHTFPVQSALLPLLLPKPHQSPSVPKSDLLVSAATGSGKTLSYLLPILSDIITRTVPRTYALIIVPTHELATQVQRTAESIASGTSLKISTAIGTRPFDVEKDHIIANDIGSTGADILVATPGRLVEHIRKNPAFTLRYLRWLIVDEADRLLGQSFQEWVEIIGNELQKPFESKEESQGRTKFDIAAMGLRIPNCAADNVRKVILSATMTRDVGKLAGLKLKRPQLIAVDDTGSRELTMDQSGDEEGDGHQGGDTGLRELNSLPSTLEEHYYPISNPSQKPLILSTLLAKSTINSGILVFTKSNEAAARLARLLELLSSQKSTKKNSKKKEEKKQWNIAVSTSDKRKRDISSNTTKFKSGAIDILISTDLMARGVDLPNAQLVINYDCPRNENDYIHRVGRTARAGNSGIAWSLVENGEARWWWAGIGKVRRGRAEGVKKETAPSVTTKDVEVYEAALETLGSEVRG